MTLSLLIGLKRKTSPLTAPENLGFDPQHDISRTRLISASFRFKVQCCRVQTVSKPSRLRSIGKDMPEVCITVTTDHFGTFHKETAIISLGNRFRLQRLIKTRPACSGVVFGFRGKKWLATTNTLVNPALFAIPILTRKCPLRAFLPGHLKLLWTQLLFPLRGGLLDLCHDDY